MEKKVWFSRRAIKLHVVILIVVPAFLALCLWQISRALGGNSLSWAYVFEWPLFAAYAIYMWWRFVHEAAQDGSPGDTAAADPGGRTAATPQFRLKWPGAMEVMSSARTANMATLPPTVSTRAVFRSRRSPAKS